MCDSGGSYSVNYEGGEISYPPPDGGDGIYLYHEFRHNGVGSSTTIPFEITGDIKSAEVLIIGGGGSGGGSNNQERGGGGGGAGRLLWFGQFEMSPGKRTVVVGGGGISPVNNWGGDTSGGNGFDSNFMGFVAAGGGGGGGAHALPGYMNGKKGGSGGGGGNCEGLGASALSANTATSFGNKGGTDTTYCPRGGAGAGGGGAGGNGHDADINQIGRGGDAKNIRITGHMKAYGRGGNGIYAGVALPPPTVDHMGHGGDAVYREKGMPGSSGVVIVRYEKPLTRCAMCPRGSIAVAGSSAVSDCVCNAGWTGSGDGCSQCVAGTYKEGSGDSTCQPCHANAITEHAGATSSDFCECQASLGWSPRPSNGAKACEQVVEEIGAQFELAVALSDFANDVGKVRTSFTNALAVAYEVDAANVRLVYYETHAADAGSPAGRRRVLQQSPGTATTVQSLVKVFASIPRISEAVWSARLIASVPGIKIQQLRAVPGITTPAAPGTTPAMVMVVAATDDSATGTNVGLYAAVGGAAFLLILVAVVVLVVVLRRRCTRTDDYDDDYNDDPSNYDVGDDNGQNMESTDYRPQNATVLAELRGAGARGAHLYHGHAYDAFVYLSNRHCTEQTHTPKRACVCSAG